MSLQPFRIRDDGDRERRVNDVLMPVVGVDRDIPGKMRFLSVGANGVQIESTTTPPPHDDTVVSYYDGTNNIETVVYKLSGRIVGTLTISYANRGEANDDLVTRVQRDW